MGQVALVDDEDYERVNQYSWHTYKRGNNLYARRKLPDGRKELMHRFILNHAYKIIDHRDQCGLNNQKSNLRGCSHAENIRNSKRHKDSNSAYKGVEFDKRKNRWRAQLFCDGKRYRGKRFHTQKEAAADYNRLALIHHGEFASLNLI